MKKRKIIIPAMAMSLAILMSLAVPMTVSAAAAGYTAAGTSSYSISDATSFVFTDSGIAVTEGSYAGYSVDGTALTIKESGTYVVSGTCSDGTITVKKNVTGVTLVLSGLELSASATAPITCNKGSEVTIVAAAGTVNNLADDEYNNDDIYTDEDLYPDIENAVIKCKDGSNVTICGTGTINVTAYGKNGVKGGYDLYEEDDEGNATDVLLSEASLTIEDVTLNITAYVNDGLKADKVLNILSGNVTVTAADDGIKSDYVMNIGAEGTDGPVVTVVSAVEGVEAATLNVWSGTVTVNATDDGINAANSDLTGYAYSYNQYGGSVTVNVTAGDGIDSNGTINLLGGTLEIYTPSQGDGDPLDSETGITLGGATVLAVGHAGMAQGYYAETPYVTFGGAGGFGAQSGLVTAGNTIQITDGSGNVVYTAKAIRDAGYVLFASPDISDGETYTLKNGTAEAATATAGTSGAGAMGGMMHGGAGGSGGMMPGGAFPGEFSEGEMPTPPDMNGGEMSGMPMPPDMNGEEMSGMPQRPGMNGESMQAPPDGEMPEPPDGELPGFAEGEDPFRGAGNGDMPGQPGEDGGDAGSAVDGTTEAQQVSAETAQSMSWFQRVISAIGHFFRSLFVNE